MRHQCGVLLDVAGSGHCSADGVVDDVGRVVGEHVSGVGEVHVGGAGDCGGEFVGVRRRG